MAAAWWSEADPQFAIVLGCAHDDGARRYASAALLRLVARAVRARCTRRGGRRRPAGHPRRAGARLGRNRAAAADADRAHAAGGEGAAPAGGARCRPGPLRRDGIGAGPATARRAVVESSSCEVPPASAAGRWPQTRHGRLGWCRSGARSAAGAAPAHPRRHRSRGAVRGASGASSTGTPTTVRCWRSRCPAIASAAATWSRCRRRGSPNGSGSGRPPSPARCRMPTRRWSRRSPAASCSPSAAVEETLERARTDARWQGRPIYRRACLGRRAPPARARARPARRAGVARVHARRPGAAGRAARPAARARRPHRAPARRARRVGLPPAHAAGTGGGRRCSPGRRAPARRRRPRRSPTSCARTSTGSTSRRWSPSTSARPRRTSPPPSTRPSDAGAVLFFDEADALFGKRTEVQRRARPLRQPRGRTICCSGSRRSPGWCCWRPTARPPWTRPSPRAPALRDPLRASRRCVARPRSGGAPSPPETTLDELDWDELAAPELSGGSIQAAALSRPRTWPRPTAARSPASTSSARCGASTRSSGSRWPGCVAEGVR